MHLILGQGSLSSNHCINVAWHGGDHKVLLNSESMCGVSPAHLAQ